MLAVFLLVFMADTKTINDYNFVISIIIPFKVG